ncbi:MAG TPA: hypothetical protein VGN69_09690 [Solirubrobacteraceae bacterium]|jgi:hypothetical protein|nr:hypothetical protein [Solirubrobacteraceae bacterium]
MAIGAGLSGCGTQPPPLPAACAAEPRMIAQALARAPAAVRLRDGTALSVCVQRASRDADLQNLGAALSSVADELQVRAAHEAVAAVSLGYLIGAVRRGGAQTNGVAAELVRRVEQAGLLKGAPASTAAALRRGLAAGQRLG